MIEEVKSSKESEGEMFGSSAKGSSPLSTPYVGVNAFAISHYKRFLHCSWLSLTPTMLFEFVVVTDIGPNVLRVEIVWCVEGDANKSVWCVLCDNLFGAWKIVSSWKGKVFNPMASCGESEKYLGSNDRSRFGNVVFMIGHVHDVVQYPRNDLHGVTTKVVDMPHHYVEVHHEISKKFWDSQHWPKHILVQYTWKEHSEIDVTSRFFVLFGSAKEEEKNEGPTEESDDDIAHPLGN
ncbi:hypothetical protein JHK86_018852 [Glycine max]|nr:hypothetical protein JHK86_018852 [Glycine max]